LINWEKKFLRDINIYIPILVFMLIIIGLVAISSAVEINNKEIDSYKFLQKQAISIFIGLIIIMIIQLFDYRIFLDYSLVIYVSTSFILLLILIIGKTVSGGTRWLLLGPLNFQPSEVAKIMVIIVLATILSDEKDKLGYLIGFFKPVIIISLPFILILLQNDLGTSLVLIFVFIIMLYIAGGNSRYISIIVFGGLSIVIFVVWAHLHFGTTLFFLKDYQIDRLIAFINPSVDPHGIGYNIIQSKIALGSGRLFGKGLFAGTQNQLNFLPAKHTDFIFSVIGEEFGFIGITLVILLYLLLFWQFIKVAEEARDFTGKLIVIGITAMFLFHVLENIGMTMGVMPITGIPLPFISYGGSSMVTSLSAMGLVLNVNMRKKKILF